MQTKEKPKYNIIQNVAWMIGLAWKTRRRLLFMGFAMAVLEILFNLAQLYIAPEILSLVEQQASLKKLLLTILFFTLAIFLSSALKQYLDENVLYSRIDVRSAIIGMVSRKECITSYPNTLNPDFIKLRDRSHTATNGNLDAAEYIWTILTELLQNVGGFIIYLGILSVLDVWLILLIIATCVAGFIASSYVNNWMFTHRDEEDKYYSRKLYIRSKAESIELAKDIRIFGLQGWLRDINQQVHDVYLDFRLKVERKKLLRDLVNAALTILRNGISYLYLIRLALSDGLSVSEFLLYFTAASTFTTWVMGILEKFTKLQKQSIDISRVREFLEFPEPFKFEEGEKVPKADCYELRLENVSFRYPGAEADTVKNINLTVAPGEKLAMVGLNGAGKSTVVKLLCGLFDPGEGRVLLNGRDIRDFNRRDYYSLFSAVFQDFSILDCKLSENIAQRTDNIDYERMADCIEKAGLTETIAELPHGVDTHVGREVFLDGVLFSGGQTQRLMLARALYKDGPILMLDEPTAALDPIAENDIYLKYKDMTEGKTSLFISHRLASTRFCDRIIFISQGRISEEGTHEELLKKGGEYARLFDVQSRYYQEGRDF